jgi:hypothetical protein
MPNRVRGRTGIGGKCGEGKEEEGAEEKHAETGMAMHRC